MANEIKIIIGGDASGLQKTATQSATALTNIGKAAASASTALSKTTPGFNQAAQSLTNLSRVAQDAPFGFIGIQNNLNPLIESFGRLKQETGTTAGAFKALASSLVGPAGVGLALGVVTGLVTVAIQKYGSLGNALGALFGEYSALAKANDELGKSLAEATGKASAEQAVINSLVGIARNEALSRDARQEAISKLNKEYDEFLPKLTLENINTKAVTDSVNKLNEALLRQAKIKGVQDLIAKEFQKLTEIMTSAPQESLGFFDNLGAIISGTGNIAKTATDQFATGLKRQSEAADDARQRIELFNKTLNELLTTEAKEGTLFTETQKRGVDALKARLAELERIKKVTKDITTLTDIEQQIFDVKTKITLRDAVKNGLSKQEINAALVGLQQELQEAFNREVLAFEAIPKVKVTSVELAEIPTNPIESKIAKATGLDKEIKIDVRELKIKILGRPVVEAVEFAQKAAQQLRDTIANSLTGAFGDAASTIGEAFGNILGGEGIGQSLAKAAQGMLGIIGGVLQEIGKQIIATSVAVQALKKALTSLFSNPILALGAGLALVALGGLLKNIKFDLPKFQEGGITSGPSSGFPAILHPNEAIIPLNKLPDIVGRLKGTDVSVTLVPTIRFSMADFVIGFERIQNRRSRLG